MLKAKEVTRKSTRIQCKYGELTSEDTLKDHFERYGSVSDSVVVKNGSTKNPRGFGFVRFADQSSADKALNDGHVILSRTVEVKRAKPRSEPKNQKQSSGLNKSNNNGAIDNQTRTKKIFVGGLSANVNKEELKNYFELFGIITDVVVMHNSVTHRPRGFGFITFDSEDSTDKVMQKRFHKLNGRLVEVKRALPKEEINCNGSDYFTRNGVGRGSPYNKYHPCDYTPTYGAPRYEPYPSYPTYIFVDWYPFGYEIVPMTHFGPGVSPARVGCLLPYDISPIYPGYDNGTIVGMHAGGYNIPVRPGVFGELDQNVGYEYTLSNVESPEIDVEKLNVESLSLNGSSGATLNSRLLVENSS